MPIEIKELVIRAAVDTPEGPPTEQASPADPEVRSRFIAECVEEVMEILERKSER